MREKRVMLLFLIATAGLFFTKTATPAQTNVKQKVEVTTTQRVAFAPDGMIQIKDSYGEVRIEGWDQPDVELTVTKATQKEYAPRDQARERAKLEKIKVTATQGDDGSLLISTMFLSRHPLRPLQGKTNLNLTYRIKVPRQSHLSIKHDVGAVAVIHVIGDIKVTNRIGEVTLKLPESEQYAIDAKAKIGDVTSDFNGESERQLLIGAKLESYRRRSHQLYLRVGIGEIAINKLPQ